MQRFSGRPAEQVFHHKRHPAKGAVRQVGGPGLAAGLVKQGVNHRVEPRVELFDSGNRGIDQLQGRSLSVFDECGLGGCILIGELVWHDGTPSQSRMAVPLISTSCSGTNRPLISTQVLVGV